MKSYEAAAVIDAEPAAIWQILTDGPGYPGWDSGVDRVEGTIGPGETIKVFAAVRPGRAFPVRVAEFVPGERMRWTGGMPLGLFTGVRTFTLAPDGGGATRLTVREEYTGPLLPLIWPTMPDLGSSFVQFVNGVKHQAEQRADR